MGEMILRLNENGSQQYESDGNSTNYGRFCMKFPLWESLRPYYYYFTNPPATAKNFPLNDSCYVLSSSLFLLRL